MKSSSKVFILALSFILLLSFIGCSSNQTADIARDESAYDMGNVAGSPEPEDYESPAMESELEPEKVITTINLDYETTKFDQTTDELMKLVEKYKAYIEYSNISYNQYYNNKSYKYGSYVIRVPKDDLISFKTELNGIGNMISENTSKEDVTKQYRDTESRLRVITTKEERILALLEKAEKIEDIIALENQLTEIIYEKENLQSSLMNIDDKVDFSTIKINIQEVENLRNTETVETNFGTRIKNAIEHSLYGFKNGLQNIIIRFIYIAPFLILLGIVLFVAYKVFKKFGKNNKKLDD